MRQMPSVTVTTEPTLRASVAAAKFWMRALIRSLISEALMDISTFLWCRAASAAAAARVSTSTRQFDFQPGEPAPDRAVDQEVAGSDDRAPDQARVGAAV